jgi:hypothetical protein
VLSFHALTNCPFSISFLLIFIHVMGGVEGVPQFFIVQTCGRANVSSSYPLFFQALAHSFALTENSTLLFSSNSTLFAKNTRGWGHVQPARSSLRRTLGRRSLPRITGHESRGIRPPRISSLLYILTPLLLSFSHEGHF